jgi:hypothetical protein
VTMDQEEARKVFTNLFEDRGTGEIAIQEEILEALEGDDTPLPSWLYESLEMQQGKPHTYAYGAQRVRELAFLGKGVHIVERD